MLVINHTIGVIGLNHSTYHAVFSSISWLNLVLSFLLVLVFHRTYSTGWVGSLLFAFMLGMVVEALGVATGFPFGNYTYTEKLGWQIFDVPLIIGTNWALLSYCTAYLTRNLNAPIWRKVLLGATCMMLLDLLLEPFAIRHGLWVWHEGFPPVQNYLSWFVVSLPIQWLMAKSIKESNNPLVTPYLVILALFLMADYLLSVLI